MPRFLPLTALLTLLVGCGTLSVGPQGSQTGSLARYTDSFDAASPDGATYSRPTAVIGLTGSLGYFQIVGAGDTGTAGQFGLGFFEGDAKYTATATNAAGAEVEQIRMSTRDRGLELILGLGENTGPVGSLALFRRETIANRSGQFGGLVQTGTAFVVRPQIGAHITASSVIVFGMIGYDIPVLRNQPVLPGSFSPTRQDLGDAPIGAGQSGFVTSLRVRV